VSGAVSRSGDEKTFEARHAARPTHALQRGAERGRGEAAERERRERRCDHEVSGDRQAREFVASAHSRASERRSLKLGLGLVNYHVVLL
jgi:hypothetical protein